MSYEIVHNPYLEEAYKVIPQWKHVYMDRNCDDMIWFISINDFVMYLLNTKNKALVSRELEKLTMVQLNRIHCKSRTVMFYPERDYAEEVISVAGAFELMSYLTQKVVLRKIPKVAQVLAILLTDR